MVPSTKTRVAALALAALLSCAGAGQARAEQPGDRTVALLKKLISFDTSNGPGVQPSCGYAANAACAWPGISISGITVMWRAAA